MPTGFNPRPTRRQAETFLRPRSVALNRVSIHGPPEGRPKREVRSAAEHLSLFQSTAHPKAGRNRRQVPHSGRLDVSIHGPPEGRPKPPSGPCTCTGRWFQSTAHPKAGRNPERTATPANACSFQSTAHPKAGRNAQAMREYSALLGFNPRPTRRQAETRVRSAQRHSGQVSIHGPPEGRPKPFSRHRLGRRAGFQSTAHPKAGRNAAVLPDTIGPFSFNPRPTRRQAETRDEQLSKHHGVSIHGPPEGRPKPDTYQHSGYP